jgi:hypothetical protein
MLGRLVKEAILKKGPVKSLKDSFLTNGLPFLLLILPMKIVGKKRKEEYLGGNRINLKIYYQ